MKLGKLDGDIHGSVVVGFEVQGCRLSVAQSMGSRSFQTSLSETVRAGCEADK